MVNKWISKAIKKPEAPHRELDVPEGQKISASKLKRADLAKTLKGLKK